MPAISSKAVWRVDGVTALRAADSDLGIFGREAVDAVSRGSQCRVGQAMFLRVPEMDPRLIAHLDPDAGFANRRCNLQIMVSSACHEVSGSK